MTAPDLGLTDLIAAHYRHCVSEEIRLDPETGVHTKWIECTCVCGADTSVEVTGDREAASRFADAAHVALVVEQHTNGRTTELEADSANWKSYYDDAKRVIAAGTVNWTATILDRDDWKVRAEKAEATIARVEKLAHDMREWCSPHGISVTYSDRICAVLEGE